MKKRIFLACAVTMACLTMFLISCNKEGDTCTCTETDYEGYSATRELDPASYGATNCSDLEIKLRMQAGSYSEFDYTCM